jgi:RHS repeat-associated protein
VVERYEAGAFGELQGSAPQVRHQYTGEYWDADARLVYLRARWYDPAGARFIASDAFAGRQTDPRSVNRYLYAHSDAVQHIDPSGLTTTTLDSLAATNVVAVLTRVALPVPVGWPW